MSEQDNIDIAFMQNPSQWRTSVLPIKRTARENPNVGILTTAFPEVFFINIWDYHGLNADDYKNIKGKVYKSHQAMFEDGWRVD